MHRFGAAISRLECHHWNSTMRNEKTGMLVGIALWDSKENMLASLPVMEDAVKNDDFKQRDVSVPETFYLHET